ncbi:hypothetical protein DPMN_023781 [Dreissena polymorpha]|uniref:Uncharacterized protein n=1 Tax=Dreissena polymorpha TaxID=45954 RepID=A0A9D4LLS5_DREPO|nr:hypothetical protein DPMN_023781 [Dreissena polymorpha]
MLTTIGLNPWHLIRPSVYPSVLFQQRPETTTDLTAENEKGLTSWLEEFEMI